MKNILLVALGFFLFLHPVKSLFIPDMIYRQEQSRNSQNEAHNIQRRPEIDPYLSDSRIRDTIPGASVARFNSRDSHMINISPNTASLLKQLRQVKPASSHTLSITNGKQKIILKSQSGSRLRLRLHRNGQRGKMIKLQFGRNSNVNGVTDHNRIAQPKINTGNGNRKTHIVFLRNGTNRRQRQVVLKTNGGTKIHLFRNGGSGVRYIIKSNRNQNSRQPLNDSNVKTSSNTQAVTFHVPADLDRVPNTTSYPLDQEAEEHDSPLAI